MPPVHPGEILLEEFLQPLGVSQYQLAKAVDVPAGRVALGAARVILPSEAFAPQLPAFSRRPDVSARPNVSRTQRALGSACMEARQQSCQRPSRGAGQAAWG